MSHRNQIGQFIKGHIPKNKGCSLVIATCRFCEKEFQYKKGKSSGKYCSKECYLLFRKKPGFKIPNTYKIQKGNIPWNKGMNTSVEKTCLECDKKFSVPNFRKETAEFCSKSCAGKQRTNLAKYQEEYWRDKIEGGYIPITPENKLERKRFRESIQKEVLKRDNYTCQMCDARGCHLHVDHIQSWAEYVELRFDINNCRTLCVDCHYLVTFGKKKPINSTWGENTNYTDMEV